MTHQEINASRLMRSQGLCGWVEDGHVCVLPQGHDGGRHEHTWTITRLLLEDPYARDSRESLVVFQVTDGVRKFDTANLVHAEWLRDTLTELCRPDKRPMVLPLTKRTP